MKLEIGDKQSFDQWHSQVIQKLSEDETDYLDDNKISLLNIQKLMPPSFDRFSREIDVSPSTNIESIIQQLTGEGSRTITHPDRLTIGTITQNLYCLPIDSYPLNSSKTLADYDIQESDLLLLDKHTVVEDLGGISYGMLVVGSKILTDFCEMVQTPEDIERRHTLDRLSYREIATWIPQSILLYTDEDSDLAQYIRYNFSSLDKLTGPYLDIYTIEQPTQVRGISARVYWKAMVDQATYSFLNLMGWTRYKPFDKSEAYKIARMIGIYPNALPCIILYNNIKSSEKIVITISGNIRKFFRDLITVIINVTEELIQNHQKPTSDNTKATLDDIKAILDDAIINRQTYFNQLHALSLKISSQQFEEFKNRFVKSWSTLQKEAGEKVSFNFYGQTVFINRPNGHLEIKDFQNE